MAQINVLHPGDPIQNQDSNAGRKRSSFDLSSVVYNTSRFGEISTHFVTNAIPADHFNMKCHRNVKSLSLKAPFLGTINEHQDYFFVPMSCLLPRNSELIQAQPNIGDDVPSDVYTNIKEFRNNVPVACTNSKWFLGYKSLFNSMKTGGGSTLTDAIYYFRLQVQLAQILRVECLFSEGSLLNELGCNCSRDIEVWNKSVSPTEHRDDVTVDQWIEHWLTDPDDGVLSHFDMIELTDPDDSTNVKTFYRDPARVSDLNFRDLLDFIRENGIWAVTNAPYVASVSYATRQDYYDFLCDYMEDSTDFCLEAAGALTDDSADVDLARVLSYQMVCAHFYSNDSVDFIYNAELFRDNALALLQKGFVSYVSNYSWNGILKPYDVFSEFTMKNAFANSAGAGIVGYTTDAVYYRSAFFALLFSRRHSLRYVDAITGLRTRPLAVGSTLVNVSGSSVDVVDITRGILIQRFLNHVNRTGRKLSNYIKGLFGTEPSRDICDPLFLSATTSTIFTSETQNTGADQLTEANSVTAKFLDESSSHGFEFDVHDYGVLLGVTYYDIRRPYTGASDPLIHVRDRYDLFNPFIEDSGDQGYRANDISNSDRSGGLFGYQQRYSEYKQTIDRCIGGFPEFLPGFALPYEGLYFGNKINPENIRSWNRELDPLFVSLTGNSLAQYFHFYHKTTLDVYASRAMSANAKIL